jgi:hypothetical protein
MYGVQCIFMYIKRRFCVVQWTGAILGILIALPQFFVLFIFLLIVLPIKEPFKIKLELFLNVIIFCLWGLTYCITFFSFYSQYIDYYIPSNLFLYLYFSMSSTVNVLIPILETFDFLYPCKLCCRKKKTDIRKSKKHQSIRFLTTNDKEKYLNYMINNVVDDADIDSFNFNTENHLISVLENVETIQYFKEFCGLEWSSENIICYIKFKEWLLITDLDKKIESAQVIIHSFIETKSLFEINISFESRDSILKKAINLSSNIDIIFSDLEKELLSIMIDTWSRFVHSHNFKRMQKELSKKNFLKDIGLDSF